MRNKLKWCEASEVWGISVTSVSNPLPNGEGAFELGKPNIELLNFHPPWVFIIFLKEKRVHLASLRPHGLQPTRLLCPWGFSRQEHWSGLPYPPPGALPNPGIEPRIPMLQADSFTNWAIREAQVNKNRDINIKSVKVLWKCISGYLAILEEVLIGY